MHSGLPPGETNAQPSKFTDQVWPHAATPKFDDTPLQSAGSGGSRMHVPVVASGLHAVKLLQSVGPLDCTVVTPSQFKSKLPFGAGVETTVPLLADPLGSGAPVVGSSGVQSPLPSHMPPSPHAPTVLPSTSHMVPWNEGTVPSDTQMAVSPSGPQTVVPRKHGPFGWHSPWKSSQTPPQQLLAGTGQTVPQPPQLFASVLVTVQTSGVAEPGCAAQSSWPAGQEHETVEVLQMLPAATWVAHVCVDSQLPPTQVCTASSAGEQRVAPGVQTAQPTLGTQTSPVAAQLVVVTMPVELQAVAVVPLQVGRLPMTQPQKPPPAFWSHARPGAQGLHTPPAAPQLVED